MRAQLVARDSLVERMERKGFTNRRLAKYAECAAGTIDNLVGGRTQSLNKPRVAELICEALDVPFDFFFVSEISRTTTQVTPSRGTARRVAS